MHTAKLVFSQLLENLPLHISHKCVDRYRGDFKVKEFTCLDQYPCMAFTQLTYRESLRDIEACLQAQKSKLYHMGIRSSFSRNNLVHANKVRDWRIYADLAHAIIHIARKMYVGDSFAVELLSKSAHEEQNHNDKDYQPDSAAGGVTPRTTMRPDWNHSQERQYQNYE